MDRPHQSEAADVADVDGDSDISRRGLRNAMVGAGALVLNQAGIAAAQTATPTLVPGDRLRKPAVENMSTVTTTQSSVWPTAASASGGAG